ncbi:MAG TPA: hypothetical protein VMW36_02785 [Patescibacteria group bacterium]|nr:hypothetical protein [Patescibacteria group bacterium]
MNNRNVGALKIKGGPTESGGEPVGGELVPMDKLSLFFSQYGLLLLLLLIPLAYVLYKKRGTVFGPIVRLHTAFWRLTH